MTAAGCVRQFGKINQSIGKIIPVEHTDIRSFGDIGVLSATMSHRSLPGFRGKGPRCIICDELHIIPKDGGEDEPWLAWKFSQQRLDDSPSQNSDTKGNIIVYGQYHDGRFLDIVWRPTYDMIYEDGPKPVLEHTRYSLAH